MKRAAEDSLTVAEPPSKRHRADKGKMTIGVVGVGTIGAAISATEKPLIAGGLCASGLTL